MSDSILCFIMLGWALKGMIYLITSSINGVCFSAIRDFITLTIAASIWLFLSFLISSSCFS